MNRSSQDSLAEQLRRAIAARDALRPGTAAHWRAACEARALMKRLSAEERFAAGVGTHTGAAQAVVRQPAH